MNEQPKICSFFGHRDVVENIEPQLSTSISYVVEKLGVTEFYVGGYGDFDAKAKHAVLRLKEKHPELKLYLTLAYLPVHNKPMATGYDDTLYFEGLETAPKRFAISKRNRIMVQQSDVIICYLKRDHGGAFTAVQYAKRQHKPIFNCACSDIVKNIAIRAQKKN